MPVWTVGPRGGGGGRPPGFGHFIRQPTQQWSLGGRIPTLPPPRGARGVRRAGGDHEYCLIGEGFTFPDNNDNPVVNSPDVPARFWWDPPGLPPC